MHLPTHVMSGWCVADLFDLTPRERLFAMVAASAADLDGLGLFISLDYYAAYHHVLAHNLPFGIVVSTALAVASTHRLKAFWLFLGLFHLHLLLDYYGSGPGWGIAYLWPFSDRVIENPAAWEFSSWQNLTAAGLLFGWMVVILIRRKRTPLELICPSLEEKLVRGRSRFV